MHSPAHILDQWREFPAAADPRPIVLVDGYVRRSGFQDDASKTAFLNGAIDAAEGVEVPMAVLALLRPPPTRPSRRLEIATVERLQSTFQTDRGPAALASYALTIPGADEPVIVLDPETPVWWPPEASADSPGEGGSAAIEADQRTLHVIAGGAGPPKFLRCDFIEAETAVVALPVIGQRPAGRDRPIPAVLRLRPLTGRLERPLGGRVLLTANGDPIAVQPAAPRGPVSALQRISSDG